MLLQSTVCKLLLHLIARCPVDIGETVPTGGGAGHDGDITNTARALSDVVEFGTG